MIDHNDHDELLSLAEMYAEIRREPFTTLELVQWAIAEGHLPATMTELEHHKTVERLNAAMDEAREELPDGTRASQLLTHDPTPPSDP
jgi:hypothetical protein